MFLVGDAIVHDCTTPYRLTHTLAKMPKIIRQSCSDSRYADVVYTFLDNTRAADNKIAVIRGLMLRHGLHEWQFVIDNAQSRAGACNYDKKTLTFSKYLLLNVEITEEQVSNIVLHEIAHALVGPDHLHDDVWRNKALSIGCDGMKFHQLLLYPARGFITCSCKQSFKYIYRMTKSVANKNCNQCNQQVTLNHYTFSSHS